MKKTYPIILAFAVILLFFIQSVGTLIESIYILDLMKLNLDTKVLGVLFFFAPLLLIPLYKTFRQQLIWATFALLLISRGFLPYLDTAGRLMASGIATAAVISLFLLLLGFSPVELLIPASAYGLPPGWHWLFCCPACSVLLTRAWIIPSALPEGGAGSFWASCWPVC